MLTEHQPAEGRYHDPHRLKDPVGTSGPGEQRAFQEGRTMSVEAALAFAQRQPARRVGGPWGRRVGPRSKDSTFVSTFG